MTKQSTTEITVPIRIILMAPPAGVDFGIQEGKGNDYKTIQVQRSKGPDLEFVCSVGVKGNRDDGPPNFVGSIVQGPPMGRFIYIDIGKSAGRTIQYSFPYLGVRQPKSNACSEAKFKWHNGSANSPETLTSLCD